MEVVRREQMACDVVVREFSVLAEVRGRSGPFPSLVYQEPAHMY